jgi:hypothetical protein
MHEEDFQGMGGVRIHMRSWLPEGARGRRDFVTDIGLGLRIGSLGFYWAYPLAGDDRGINFFVRLGRRL